MPPDPVAAPVPAPAPAAPAPAPAPVPVVPPADPAPAPPAPAPSPAPVPTSSLLSDEAPGSDPWAGVDAKFQVKKEDGTLDQAATVAKLNKSYSDMQRMASRTEPRPRTADEYTVPESVKEIYTPGDPKLAEFRKGAHGVAMSQKQMDFVLETYGKLAPTLVQGAQALEAKEAEAALRTEWGADFDEQLAAADLALHQLAPDDLEVTRAVQNRPALIRLLAKVGAQLAEDTAPSIAGGALPDDIMALQASEAYSNPRHANHKSVSAKVSAYYARLPGSNVPIE